MPGIRGILKDIFIIYVAYRLIRVWLFSAEFTTGLGVMVIVMMLISVWFTLERMGVL